METYYDKNLHIKFMLVNFAKEYYRKGEKEAHSNMAIAGDKLHGIQNDISRSEIYKFLTNTTIEVTEDEIQEKAKEYSEGLKNTNFTDLYDVFLRARYGFQEGAEWMLDKLTTIK